LDRTGLLLLDLICIGLDCIDSMGLDWIGLD
jgi:hypothetical protein